LKKVCSLGRRGVRKAPNKSFVVWRRETRKGRSTVQHIESY
jgi:hypothetical protein